MILFDNIIIYQHISVPIKYTNFAHVSYLRAPIQKGEKTREWVDGGAPTELYNWRKGEGGEISWINSIKMKNRGFILNFLWTFILPRSYNMWEHPKSSLAKEDRVRVILQGSKDICRQDAVGCVCCEKLNTGLWFLPYSASAPKWGSTVIQRFSPFDCQSLTDFLITYSAHVNL